MPPHMQQMAPNIYEKRQQALQVPQFIIISLLLNLWFLILDLTSWQNDPGYDQQRHDSSRRHVSVLHPGCCVTFVQNSTPLSLMLFLLPIPIGKGRLSSQRDEDGIIIVRIFSSHRKTKHTCTCSGGVIFMGCLYCIFPWEIQHETYFFNILLS